MSEIQNVPTSNLPEVHSGVPSTMPYEAPLSKAFDKLTSQIFIFLLAYMILLIGLGMLGPQLTDSLRSLLYIIPILGLVAHVGTQQRKIVHEARRNGIYLKAGIVRDSASVSGVRGAKSSEDLPDNVSVSVGMATGKAEIAGVTFDNKSYESNTRDSSEVLVVIYNDLHQKNQIKLLAAAQNMLDKQNED